MTMTLHFNEKDVIIANAPELAQCGEAGSTALNNIIDILEAWKREIHNSLLAVNAVIAEVRLVAAPTNTKTRGLTAQRDEVEPAVAVSDTAAPLRFVQPLPPLPPQQGLATARPYLIANQDVTKTPNIKNSRSANTEQQPVATTDVKTMLHQQQVDRRVIFRLREEKQWHNAGQPIKLRGELIELTFDFEVGTCCPEPGCFAKFGWNTPVLKVWPGTAVPAPASAKKTVPTQEVANNNRSPEDFRLICLRHASKPLTWEEIEID